MGDMRRTTMAETISDRHGASSGCR
jgi:hypothetical protein